MKNVLTLVQNLGPSIGKKLSNGAAKLVMCKGYSKVSPHITEKTIWVVDKAVKLKDYAPDIKRLYWKDGAPVEEIAKLLGVSVSYVYKLLGGVRK